MRFVHDPDAYVNSLLAADKSCPFRFKEASRLDGTIYDLQWPIWTLMDDIHDSPRNRVTPGLYLGLFSVMTSASGGLMILVPRTCVRGLTAQKMPIDSSRSGKWLRS